MKPGPLEVKNIGYRFRGAASPTLDGVSFTVAAGGRLGILGHNGSGKSTLLKILASILEPTTGEVLYDGVSISKSLARYRSVVNYSAGGARGFYPRLSGRDNLRFFSGIKGNPIEGPEIDRLLAQTGLASSAFDKKYFQYSLGMRQRMNLAKILLDPSEVILVDEPTNGLDPEGIELAREILNRKLDGKTRVIISHDPEFLRATSDQALRLTAGRLEPL